MYFFSCPAFAVSPPSKKFDMPVREETMPLEDASEFLYVEVERVSSLTLSSVSGCADASRWVIPPEGVDSTKAVTVENRREKRTACAPTFMSSELRTSRSLLSVFVRAKAEAISQGWEIFFLKPHQFLVLLHNLGHFGHTST